MYPPSGVEVKKFWLMKCWFRGVIPLFDFEGPRDQRWSRGRYMICRLCCFSSYLGTVQGASDHSKSTFFRSASRTFLKPYGPTTLCHLRKPMCQKPELSTSRPKAVCGCVCVCACVCMCGGVYVIFKNLHRIFYRMWLDSQWTTLRTSFGRFSIIIFGIRQEGWGMH